jgi:thiol-disulfide isomerase/thioredoxin
MSDRWFWRVAGTALAAALLAWISAPVVRADEPAQAGNTAHAIQEHYPSETLSDSAGGQLSLQKSRGRVATVLVCMSIDCPVSNEYLPTLNRLAEHEGPRGINFIGIDPNAGDTRIAMAEHARQYKLTFPFVKDDGAKLSKRLRFQVTPEVFVFDKSGELVYRGRIDDRYRAGGGAANAKVTSDLQRALDELIGGKPVSVSHTKAMGCPIQETAPPAG